MQTFARVSIDVLRYQYTAKLTIFFKNCLLLFQIDRIAIFHLKTLRKKPLILSKVISEKRFFALIWWAAWHIAAYVQLSSVCVWKSTNCSQCSPYLDCWFPSKYVEEVAQKLVPICNCEGWSTTVENVRGKRFPSRCLRVPFCCLQHLQAKVF